MKFALDMIDYYFVVKYEKSNILESYGEIYTALEFIQITQLAENIQEIEDGILDPKLILNELVQAMWYYILVGQERYDELAVLKPIYNTEDVDFIKLVGIIQYRDEKIKDYPDVNYF